MLGDKQSDVESGINAGINAFLIDKEHNIEYWTKKILNIEI
jgi:phosphoglycolate phosphatase-like HAD superfamily hydrolase